MLQLNGSHPSPTTPSQFTTSNFSVLSIDSPLISTKATDFSFSISTEIYDNNVYSTIVPPIELNSVTSAF